jgi:hypothetical protein
MTEHANSINLGKILAHYYDMLVEQFYGISCAKCKDKKKIKKINAEMFLIWCRNNIQKSNEQY